jgi:uncharacterized membrane protein
MNDLIFIKKLLRKIRINFQIRDKNVRIMHLFHYSLLRIAGCRLQVAGCRLLVAGCRLLVAGCWLQVAGCWLLVAGCWLLVAGCRLQVGRIAGVERKAGKSP